MGVKLNSSGGGSVTINPTLTSTTSTLTVPAVTGNLVTTGDSGTVSTNMIAASAVTPAKFANKPFTSATQTVSAVASVTFSNVPSWVRRITIIGQSVKNTSAQSTGFNWQLGTGGVLTTTGYVGTMMYASGVQATGGFSASTMLTTAFSSINGIVSIAAGISNITAVFNLQGSNVWVGTIYFTNSSNASGPTSLMAMTCGTVTLSGTLDTIGFSIGGSNITSGTFTAYYE